MFLKYVDGGFDDEEREEVESHIAECPKCRELFEVLSPLQRQSELFRWSPASDREVRGVMEHFRLSGKIRKIFRWIHGKLPDVSFLTPSFSPVRGDSAPSERVGAQDGEGKASFNDHVLLEEKMDDLRVLMYAEKRTDGKIDIWATVKKGEEKAENVRLVFIREGGGIVSRPLAEDFERFEGVETGPCRLVVKQDAEEKARFKIDFGKEKVVLEDDHS